MVGKIKVNRKVRPRHSAPFGALVPLGALVACVWALGSGAHAATERSVPSRYATIEVPEGTYDIPVTNAGDGIESTTKYRVRIQRPYRFGVAEVSQGLWRNVMGVNPSTFSACGDDCPVDSISLSDAALFANALSAQENLTPCYAIHGADVRWTHGTPCDGYRIPTESEWSAAAVFVGGVALLGSGSHGPTSPLTPHPVRGERAVIVRDLVGNVWEWTWDDWGARVQSSLPGLEDGAWNPPPNRRGLHVVRGGSWLSSLSGRDVQLRTWEAAERRSIDLGVRLVRDAEPTSMDSVARNSRVPIYPIVNR